MRILDAFDWRSGLFQEMSRFLERLFSRGVGTWFGFRSAWNMAKANSMAHRIKFGYPVPNAQFRT